MAFFGLFKKNEKDLEVLLKERKKSGLQESAVAAAFAEAGEHATARSMMDQTKANRKLLVIARGNAFSPKLADYALEMAARLDFEVLALNVTDAPLALAKERREKAAADFAESCAAGAAALMEKAGEAGVVISHRVEIGRQDDVVEKLHAEFPAMRYVLTEPDSEAMGKTKGEVDIPVFDLGSYHGAAA